MNRFNCNSFCQLLCCPPIPSKIVAKLAFMPPPKSYELIPCSQNKNSDYFLRLYSCNMDHIFAYLTNIIQASKAITRKGNEIAILYLPINTASKLTFLVSHGNAVDLGLMANFMYELGSKLNVNIMCYDYSGYGASTGKPLERNLYADSECAFEVLKTKYDVPLDKIVLYGQSIGTVPTVHLATIHRVGAVVLHSPLMSGLRLAFPWIKRNYCCDVFSNLLRIPKILSPTLIIHGTEDDVVHVTHGYRIYSALADHLLDPLFIDGAGHNNCELYPQYLIRLTKLVNDELPFISKSLVSEVNNVEDYSIPIVPGTNGVDSHDSSISSSDSIPACIDQNINIENDSTKSLISNLNKIKNIHKKTNNYNVVKDVDYMTQNDHDSSLHLGSISLRLFKDENINRSLQNINTFYNSENEALDNRSLQSSEMLINNINHTLSMQSNSLGICELPPPPVPPTFDCISSSNKLLWSVHAQRDGKMYKLPRKRSIPVIKKDAGGNCGVSRFKIVTLPHDFFSTEFI